MKDTPMAAAARADEPVLPGPTPEQLARPIDQFQRYHLTGSLVRQLGVPPGARVLDVGGAPGPAEMFLPDYDVVVLDVEGEHQTGRFVVADGGRLPFADDTFDAVVSLDTLEHVPTDVRPDFLAEARRVSRGTVVLSAPFATPGVVEAEAALLQFISMRLSAEFPTAVWLQEHRDWGLPRLEEVVAALGDGEQWSCAALPSGYLPRWLGTMIADHELLATGLPALDALHTYYNTHVSPHDARTPAYRHIVAASSVLSAQELHRRVQRLRSAGDGEYAALVSVGAMATSVLHRRLDAAMHSPELLAARSQIAEREERIHDLERLLADREAHLVHRLEALEDKERHIQDLRAERSDLVERLSAASVGATVRRLTRRNS